MNIYEMKKNSKSECNLLKKNLINFRRSATLREEEFQLRDNKTNPRLPSMLPPAPE